MQRPTASGSRSTLTPSASSTSAEPDFEVAERLPCLATAQPAAAATRAAVVETLKVEGPPPVPAVSTRSARLGVDRGGERAHRPRQADQLGDRLPLRPQGDQEGAGLDRLGPPFHDLGEHGRGVVGGQVLARADRVDRAADDVVRHRDRPSPSSRKFASRCLPCGVSTDSGWNWTPSAGSSRWRAPITTLAEVGGQFELVGEVGVGDQRVVAAGDHRGRQAGVDRPAVVLDLGVLAVDRLALDDLAAEDLDHRLVAEADAEHRRAGLGEGADRRRRRSPPRRACRGRARRRGGRRRARAARRPRPCRCGPPRARRRAHPGTGPGCR